MERLKIKATTSHAVKLELELSENEARELMALMQNAQVDDEPITTSNLRETIFGELWAIFNK